MAYNGSGQLSTITDPGGRAYTLTWTGTHITGLSDTAGRKVTYGYDAGGNLTDVYGAGTTRTPVLKDDDHATFGYDAAHLMTSMRKPAQFGSTATPTPVTGNVYDASERVTKQTDPLGGVTVFEYGPDGTGLTAGQTRVTDPVGHKTLYTYQSGMLTSETRGSGTAEAGTWTYTYDPISMGMTSSSDPNGNLETFAYDDHGNQISKSDARGFTTSYVYDDSDQLITTVDPAGLRTDRGYDESGHITAPGSGFGLLTSTTTQPADGSAPARVSGTYYEDAAHPADLTRSVDARGNTTLITYDAKGNLAGSTDPEGNKTLYGFDADRSLMTSSVSPAGTAAGTTPGCTPPAKGCTSFSYDAWGHQTRTVDPLGRTTSAVYDANGNQISSTDANNHTTVNGYDAVDQKTTVTRPDTTRTQTVYNGDGTVARTIDAAGVATLYGYDAQRRQTSRTDPGGRVTAAAYDTAGNLLTTTDPQNRVTTYAYDPAGKPVSVTYSDGTTPNVTAIGYNPAGLRTAMTDGTGTTTWAYDVFGELTSQTNGAGAATTFGYDAGGNQTSLVYPGGTGRTVTRTFDKDNRLTGLQDWNTRTTGFGYDADSHWNSTTYPNGTVATSGWDDAGRLSSDTLKKGTTTLAALTYTRDLAGQLNGETPTGVPGSAQTFGYTARDQLKTATAGSTTTGFGYDAADDPTQVGTANQVFDTSGRLCWSTTGTAPVNPACAAPASGATTYTYDPQGNRTKATTGAGAVTSYGYDQADRLTTATTGGATATYRYDGNGLRASKTAGHHHRLRLGRRGEPRPALRRDHELPLRSRAGSRRADLRGRHPVVLPRPDRLHPRTDRHHRRGHLHVRLHALRHGQRPHRNGIDRPAVHGPVHRHGDRTALPPRPLLRPVHGSVPERGPARVADAQRVRVQREQPAQLHRPERSVEPRRVHPQARGRHLAHQRHRDRRHGCRGSGGNGLHGADLGSVRARRRGGLLGELRRDDDDAGRAQLRQVQVRNRLGLRGVHGLHDR